MCGDSVERQRTDSAVLVDALTEVNDAVSDSPLLMVEVQKHVLFKMSLWAWSPMIFHTVGNIYRR